MGYVGECAILADTAIPTNGSSLYEYLLSRQLNSLDMVRSQK